MSINYSDSLESLAQPDRHSGYSFLCVKYSIVCTLFLNVFIELITTYIAYGKFEAIWEKTALFASVVAVLIMSVVGWYAVLSHSYKLTLILGYASMVIGLLRCVYIVREPLTIVSIVPLVIITGMAISFAVMIKRIYRL